MQGEKQSSVVIKKSSGYSAEMHPRKCTRGKQVKREFITRPFGLHYNQKMKVKSVRVPSRPFK